jgi:hypothetical protein
MMVDLTPIFTKVEDHASASGWFEAVNGHEPKSAPTIHGLTAAVWVDRLRPARGKSSLMATSGLLEIVTRLYGSMLTEPMDMIDPGMMAATNDLLAAYSGDFDLGGQVRNIDLLGEFGDGLAAQAGYVELDRKIYRVMTITIPIVINDVWAQAP